MSNKIINNINFDNKINELCKKLYSIGYIEETFSLLKLISNQN
jgi:hypothetical protein